MRILIVTDAWQPQVNGVVRTLQTTVGHLRERGHTVMVVAPDQFASIPCPTYPEIRLSLLPGRKLRRIVDAFGPDAVHIATEGPLGFAAWRLCRRRRWPFTTAFHTRFPEYIHARIRLPLAISYAVVRWFHSAAVRTMVATASLQADLEARGFRNLVTWGRGVDIALFHPRPNRVLNLPHPIYLYVGRVAVEKNIQDFLDLKLDGSKLVVGDGPQLKRLRREYPDVNFVGAKHGEELAAHYAAADVFVFPSRTDTFGLVLLEALASGLPVAAYPVTGPKDVIGTAPVGCLDEDLGRAARNALSIDPRACRAFAVERSWQASVAQFEANLVRIAPDAPEPRLGTAVEAVPKG